MRQAAAVAIATFCAVAVLGCKTSAPQADAGSAALEAPSDSTSVPSEAHYFQVQGNFSGLNNIELGSFYKATSSLPGCWNFDLGTLTNAKSKVIDVPATMNGSEYTVRTYTAKQGICGYAWSTPIAVSLQFTTDDGYAGSLGFKLGNASGETLPVRCKRSPAPQKYLHCSAYGSQYGTSTQVQVSYGDLSTTGTTVNLDLIVED